MWHTAEVPDGKTGSEPAWSQEQCAQIVAEMNRILSDPIFKNSKRCVSLLRSLIDHALAGDHDRVKERTLGIEAFGRDPDYDTNADPIVRMTANEIRKRLAQWYQDPAHPHAVKIRLLPGSYVLEFEFDHFGQSPVHTEVYQQEEVPEPFELTTAAVKRPEPVPEAVPTFRPPKWPLWILAVLVISVALLALVRSDLLRSTQSLLWKPLLESNGPLIVCVTDDSSMADANNDNRAQIIANVITSRQPPPHSGTANSIPMTPFVDAEVASQISASLGARGGQPNLRRSSHLTLREIRQGPAVFVGGLSNPWSLILLSDLRYRFRIDPATHEAWIEDAQNPAKHDWKISGGVLYESSFVDYAVITRYLDKETGNWIMAVGGLGFHGTMAGGELITNSSLTGSLPAGLRSNKNFQIVLRTSVINGNAGSPQVLAVYTW
jgi:hypothetical protein